MSKRLPAVLGLPSLLFYGVGLILGAGIYSILGPAAGIAGTGLWASFALASLAALFTGLSYAELSTMFPRAGADYVYAQQAFPKLPLLAPLLGFALIATGVATASTVAVAFAGYLRVFVDVPLWIVAVLLLILITALNVIGIRESSWANIVMTLAEVAGLILVVWLGFTHADIQEGIGIPSLGGLFAGAAIVFFAFLGFEQIANLAEETRSPDRVMPRALLLSIGISTLLYVLVAVAALALLSPQRLAESESPLADAVHEVQPSLGGVLAGIALFATANTALVSLVAASRMSVGMARGGDLPKALQRTLPGRHSPWVAGLALLIPSLLLVPAGGLDVLGGVASLMALIAFVMVNASLVRLRWQQPNARRPFRVPGAIGRLPLPPLLGALISLILLTQLPTTAYLLGAALLVVFLLSMWATRSWAKKKRSQQN